MNLQIIHEFVIFAKVISEFIESISKETEEEEEVYFLVSFS